MKITFIRMRTILLAIGCVLVTAALVGIFAPQAMTVGAKSRELPIYNTQQDYKVAALTFDAAWGNEDTELLIEILDKYNIKATFFVVGDWVRKYPESVKQLHDAGHEIMNHSDKHSHMTQLSKQQVVDDINACNDEIERVTGVRPTLFRPPYGEYDDMVVSTVRGMGMEVIQWDVDSLDWKNPTPDAIVKRVTGSVKPGSIALFHNAAVNTPASLPDIIEKLLQDGYKLVKVSELIHKGEFTIDHTGKQIPAT